MVLLCAGFLISITILIFLEQIPTIYPTPTIYDKEFINGLKKVGNQIPKNETLTAAGSYPQFTYFTGHKVKIPQAGTEKTLVEFMWKINSSYLLVPEDISGPKADKSPLLIQLAERPLNKIFDYYYDHVPASQVHKMGIMGAVKKDSFEKLFEKVSDYRTEDSIFHLFKLRSSITSNNLALVADGIVSTAPVLKDAGLDESKPFGSNNNVPAQEHFYGNHYTSAINQVPNNTFNKDFITLESAKAINTGGKVNMDTIFWSTRHMMGK